MLLVNRNFFPRPTIRTVSGHLIAAAFLALATTGTGTAVAQGTPYEEAFSAYQNQKFDDAEGIWRELASAGDVNAQYALGVMHLRQEASDASPAAAFSWFDKAAAQGHATAMFNLGVAYWEGTGVAQDKTRALSLWEKAADKGDSGAQFNLGLAYYIGEERAPDLALAKSWIGQAAAQNHPEAQRILKVIEAESVPAPESQPAVVAAVDSEPETVSAATPAASEPATADVNQYWKTSSDRTPLFDKPDGIRFRELPSGTPVELNGQDGGWARITVPDGLRTWVFSKFIDIDGDDGVISGDAVRVRPEPSTNNTQSPPLGQYRRGDQVKVLRQDGDWVQIRAPKSVSAWIKVEDLIEYRDTAENRAASWERARASGA